jgi:hypothetical protein
VDIHHRQSDGQRQRQDEEDPREGGEAVLESALHLDLHRGHKLAIEHMDEADDEREGHDVVARQEVTLDAGQGGDLGDVDAEEGAG